MNAFGKTLASATGLKPSPWLGGGENVRTIDHGTYKTVIHSPAQQTSLPRRGSATWINCTGAPSTGPRDG